MNGFAMSQDEDFERIKEWFARYGRWILLAVILAAGGVAGWQGWAYYQAGQTAQASDLYYRMLQAERHEDAQAVDKAAQALVSRHAATPYAALAQLALAKRAVDQDRLAQAATRLEWVRKHAGEALLKQLATLRLAQIRLAQKRPDAALALLDTKLPGAYLPLRKTLQGDAWAAKGDVAKARAAYEEALAASRLAGLPSQWIQWKLADLPAATERKS